MRIFITGGAGFLGRAIMRRPDFFSPQPVQYTIYSRDEGKQAKARQDFPGTTCILGDVRDTERMELAMAGHDLVIHAAAMKYVPQAEGNVWEAHAVNLDGSRNVAMAASRVGIHRVVGISTDKACRPVNVYGATKWSMEKLFVEANGWLTDTQFNLVRYGNVVGSTGSVIPLFRQQARAGTITITNPDMTRFWLPVHDAVELIAMAANEPTGGTILIPRLRSATMGVVAAACALIENTGPQMKTIGQRFGEKVHEDLLTEIEALYAGYGNPMRLFPTVEGPLNEDRAVMLAYSSDHPDDHLSTPDMVDLIVEAEKDAE